MSRVNESGLIVEQDGMMVTVSRPAIPDAEGTAQEWADYLLYRQRNTFGWLELSPSTVVHLRAMLMRAARSRGGTDGA